MVFEEKSGFFTPDIIPSNPFGFGIDGFGKLDIDGKLGAGMLTVGRVGAEIFGSVVGGGFGADGKLGKDGIFGAATFGIAGVITGGKFGGGMFGCIPRGINYSFNSPPSYPGDPPPPTVNTLVLISDGNESLNSIN